MTFGRSLTHHYKSDSLLFSYTNSPRRVHALDQMIVYIVIIDLLTQIKSKLETGKDKQLLVQFKN